MGRRIYAAAALLATALAVGWVVLGFSSTAGAAPLTASIVATGHDMDYHCATGSADECAYLKIVVDKVRNGSTLPILALDHGSEVPTALVDAGFSAGSVKTVDPDNATTFAATKFVSGGKALYSAIVVASDQSCGGCDNDLAGETAINARSADFTTFFNDGGGILALAGADNFATFYKFVPLEGAKGQVVTAPFTVTSQGAALGITATMANCCATHNSFTIPKSPFVTLEKDSAGLAETIGAFDVTIGSGGFTSGAPSSSAATTTTTAGTSSVVATPTAVDAGGPGSTNLTALPLAALGGFLIFAAGGLVVVGRRLPRRH